ncbi:uncharacterized protein LOC586595 [Strongylocentrotus purpuratus]|uniref:Uncharacterized protein n=1 Tax=Strongylocentrotus purpuratus TaxID=7668 RepID=A0A7M7RHV9_STRPU|nr:uncharacterized protein LOC586595 [Strongylocentrotus purpuratus]|eukprot:XP_800400.1 PREDICTED: uncharacterized protein LOC586595 [Strongylocentrotus purpuratus]
MARLLCLVVFVTIVAATLAAPMREMSEKEAILRELLEDKKIWDWLYGDEETTAAMTTAQPTTEAPQPLPIISVGEASSLTSNRICGAAQTLFPVRNEKVESKRDLVINMIYDICLPSVGIEDLEAFGMILDFLRIGEEEDIERLVPTTPEPELETLSSAWNTLIDNLAEAQNNGETLEDEEDVQEIIVVPPPAAGENIADTDADADAGAPADANGDTGANAGADANADAGADTNADAGADTDADAGADANADAGADANADAGADANADAGADTNADAGADTNADAGGDAVADTGAEAGTGADGADTNPAPAKRLEDAELLSMLLKAIEVNQGGL